MSFHSHHTDFTSMSIINHHYLPFRAFTRVHLSIEYQYISVKTILIELYLILQINNHMFKLDMTHYSGTKGQLLEPFNHIVAPIYHTLELPHKTSKSTLLVQCVLTTKFLSITISICCKHIVSDSASYHATREVQTRPLECTSILRFLKLSDVHTTLVNYSTYHNGLTVMALRLCYASPIALVLLKHVESLST